MRFPTRIVMPNIRMCMKLKPPPDYTGRERLLPDDTFTTNKIIFKTDPKMTKPEIKQLISKMYNLHITRVNTLNVMHKRKKIQGFDKKTKEYKKAYIELKHPITLPMRPRPFSEFLKK
mmetsp:Transcript_3168/g.5582  ORF Transcript_3168/g.5582 Transcript_3168/m.5582 type:complete len:118 (-) Transcript_3168:26-379(-)